MDQWNSDESLTDSDFEDEMEGFAIEFGKIDFDSNLRASNLGDDSGSLGTMGMPSPKGFVTPTSISEGTELKGQGQYEGMLESDQDEEVEGLNQDIESDDGSSDTSMENVEQDNTAPLKQGEGGKNS